MNKDYNKIRSKFFLIFGCVGILAVILGFTKTFIIPVSTKQFDAPFSIYLHGFLSLAWVVFFVIQSLLIHTKNHKTHFNLGILGLVIALGATITLLPVGIFTVEKGLNEGRGDTAISGLIGTLTTGVMYLILVIAGMHYRKNTEAHKRLMLLATIVLLWPAWFRFRHYFPSIERPDIWFAVVLADSFIIIACIWDKYVNKKIHPVLLYIGFVIIAEHIFEVIMFDTEGWRYAAKYIYSSLLRMM